MKLAALSLLALVAAPRANPDDAWVVYGGAAERPGSGKHVVLIAGDEEYRSEEALPQLGKILAVRHGFRCTVLFPVHPESGAIDPDVRDNIPGLEALESADLMVIATRFRDLPDGQMKCIDAYLRAGKPVLGMRTATHAFNIPEDAPWAHYGNGYNGPKAEWKGGFGRLVLGEKWISHHGAHGSESTRGVPAPGAEEHPIMRGIEPESIWGPSDVYGVRLPLDHGVEPIVLGVVLARRGAAVEGDPLLGMRPDDEPVGGRKNGPLMPVAWTKPYRLPGGEPGRAFTTTMGAATDLLAEGTRRMLVNAVFDLLGLEVPAKGTDVALVGTYEPTRFGFGGFVKGRRPAGFALD